MDKYEAIIIKTTKNQQQPTINTTIAIITLNISDSNSQSNDMG